MAKFRVKFLIIFLKFRACPIKYVKAEVAYLGVILEAT